MVRLLFATACLILFGAPASGALIKYEIDATITTVAGPVSLIEVGDGFHATYFIDEATIPWVCSGGEFCLYRHFVGFFQFEGEQPVQVENLFPAADRSVFIIDNAEHVDIPGTFVDAVGFQHNGGHWTASDNATYDIAQILFSLAWLPDTTFDGLFLDNSLIPALEDAGAATFELDYRDISASGSDTIVSGTIGSYTATVVPVPATIWLFGSALGLLTCMRRKIIFHFLA
jgi:hypothetical protein